VEKENNILSIPVICILSITAQLSIQQPVKLFCSSRVVIFKQYVAKEHKLFGIKFTSSVILRHVTYNMAFSR
jgi:hypothetical protein